MVKVLFQNPWFAPGAEHFRGGKDIKGNKGRSMTACSGQLFRPGVHDVPEELIKALPETAEILDEDYVAPEPEDIDPRENMTSRDVYDIQAEHDAEEEEPEPKPAPKRRGRGRPRRS